MTVASLQNHSTGQTAPLSVHTPNTVLLNPGNGQLYLRFPYLPEVVRFINEQLTQCVFVEGTTDSANRDDGLPPPAASKPMLYSLSGEATANLPALRQLFRQHRFVVSPRAKTKLNAMRETYRQSRGLDSRVTQNGERSVLGDLLSEATESPRAASSNGSASGVSNRQPGARSGKPEITGITGRQPTTAKATTSLKIQMPRPEDEDILSGEAELKNLRNDDGLYETIMGYGGTEWVKGKKGQYRGYFRVTITHDTPALIAQLKGRYGLRLAPELPRAIAERINNLNRDIRLSRASAADLKLPVPDGLDYLPYQKAGIAYAVRKGNALIADEPGLGKTIQAIGVSNATRSIRRVLVVVPASLKINWEREWKKWCVKGLSVGRVIGGKPENWPTDDQGRTPDVIVINYDVIEQHEARLTKTPWDMMIVDEAHALKNDKAKRTQLILGHGKKNPGIPRHRTLLLTGTPILSRPNEVWTLAHALDPDYFSNKMRFALRYCDAFKGDHGWIMDGASNLRELQRELRARIMVRRKKSAVLTDLSPKTRQIIPLENAGAVKREQAAFVTAAHELRKIDQERAGLDRSNEEAYRDAARKLQDMEKTVFSQLSLQRKQTAIDKIPQVMELVEQGLDNGKLILFAHHAEVVEAYRDAINQHFKKQAKRGIAPATVAVVSGKTPTGKRQAEADRFQDDPNCKVFIGSIGAAGVGLTLTEASLVIMAELDWVPGYVTQAEDRAHRIGQLGNVLVWHAVVDGSIDARMIRRLIEKQEVIDASLDDEQETPVPQTTPPAQISHMDQTDEGIYIRFADYLEQQATQARSSDHAQPPAHQTPETEANPMICMGQNEGVDLAIYDRMIAGQGLNG